MPFRVALTNFGNKKAGPRAAIFVTGCRRSRNVGAPDPAKTRVARAASTSKPRLRTRPARAAIFVRSKAPAPLPQRIVKRSAKQIHHFRVRGILLGMGRHLLLASVDRRVLQLCRNGLTST